ncbi:hypothetical protein K493DRAFT_411369 [Basidiobolus meristosporus CBS 931.73]|uniref:Uncharacterized protein n=1 Tax=Basidiobolus meristosporus CBS 931.73 TaxID=1314790 RepID=A0A1Y1XL03_9FUNG|nr:hypothetical protein K493DRAFT_411369 [Basidiobolus meristosporus CBS 931.73]|eukprot:ORX86014.1 hypothetical protein K493DRAFT_411369 [Basidiobolus meristosporus CBS 931.73]
MKLSAIALLCAISMIDVIGMTIPNTVESNQVAAASRFQKRYNDRWNGPDDLRPNRRPSPKDGRGKEDSKKDTESTTPNPDRKDPKTQFPGPDTQPLNQESFPNDKPMDAPKGDSSQVTGNRKDDASQKTDGVQPKSDIDSKKDGDAKTAPKDAQNHPLRVEGPKNTPKTDTPGTHDSSKDATNDTKKPDEPSAPGGSSKKDDLGNSSIPRQGTPMEEIKSPKDSAKQGVDQAGKAKEDHTPDNKPGTDGQSKGKDQVLEKAQEVSQGKSQDPLHDNSKDSNPAAPKDSRFPQRPATDFPPKISSIRNDHITRSQCQDIKVHARALGIDVDAVVCIGGLVKVFLDVDVDGILNSQRKKRETCRDILYLLTSSQSPNKSALRDDPRIRLNFAIF